MSKAIHSLRRPQRCYKNALIWLWQHPWYYWYVLRVWSLTVDRWARAVNSILHYTNDFCHHLYFFHLFYILLIFSLTIYLYFHPWHILVSWFIKILYLILGLNKVRETSDCDVKCYMILPFQRKFMENQDNTFG